MKTDLIKILPAFKVASGVVPKLKDVCTCISLTLAFFKSNKNEVV